MKALKVVAAVLLGLIGLAVLLYVIGVAVNWRDQPPAAAALEIRKILADRAPVADADNGFVYAMGFSVPVSADPQAAGALRVAWLEALNRDRAKIDADPVKDHLDFNASKSLSMQRLSELCGEKQSTECREAVLAASSQPRLNLEDLQLARYRALLQRPAWREVVPLDVSAPIASFGDVMEGQRLLYVDLVTRAKSAPPGEIAATLRDDLAFWRETQKSADFLITKMISVAAIRQHFFFGNLVLREMPAARAPVIESWSVPFSTEELSMRRSMAGELSFAEGVMLQWQNGGENYFIEPDGDFLSVPGRLVSSLARPFYQHQDQMNYYAAMYLDYARRFEAPLDQYLGIAESVQAMKPDGFSFHVYNAIGHIFRGLTGTWTYGEYAIRVGSIEGQRRAALLAAQLRQRGVPPDAMAKELRGSELRNPFDGEPFEWSAEEQAVVFVGPEAEHSRKRHPYFY